MTPFFRRSVTIVEISHLPSRRRLAALSSGGGLKRARAMPGGGMAVLLVSTLTMLAACGQQDPIAVRPPLTVHGEIVEPTEYVSAVVLTGEIRAQAETELSFRTAGRVTELHADVGSHVLAGEVLARIAADEQQADVTARQAAMEAAEAEVRQTAAKFDRQKTLLAKGFTTRPDHDAAEEALRTAEANLDSATALLATAQDNLSFTELRADSAGVITARNLEVGQVVQAAESSFTIARDGPRDAVFNVQEGMIAREPDGPSIAIALLEDPNIRTTGIVREVSPTVDESSGTVQVKVELEETPPRMNLGASVSGKPRSRSRKVVILPWTSMASANGQPAVWILDPATEAVSLRPIEVAAFESGTLVVGGGLEPGEFVVTAGTKFLRPGQIVSASQGDTLIGTTGLSEKSGRQGEEVLAQATIPDPPQATPTLDSGEPAEQRGARRIEPKTEPGLDVVVQLPAGLADQAATAHAAGARIPRPRPDTPTGARH